MNWRKQMFICIYTYILKFKRKNLAKWRWYTYALKIWARTHEYIKEFFVERLPGERYKWAPGRREVIHTWGARWWRARETECWVRMKWEEGKGNERVKAREVDHTYATNFGQTRPPSRAFATATSQKKISISLSFSFQTAKWK